MEYDLGKRLVWEKYNIGSEHLIEPESKGDGQRIKGLQSLLDGLPLAKLGGFGHQNECSNVL